MADRSDIIIKNKKEKNLPTDRYGKNSGLRCHAKGSRAENKGQECRHKEATNVEHEVCDYTHNIWRHRKFNKRFKEKFESHTCKTFNRFATKDTYICKSHTVRKVL